MRLDRQKLAAMQPEGRAAALLSGAEGQWFERKSVRSGLDVIARSIVGFANAEGGLLVVGVSAGHIENVAANSRHLGELRRVPRTHCAPPPHVQFEELEVLDEGGTPVTVLVADVAPGQTLHETTAGDCFLRVGDSTIKLNAGQREELAYDRGASQYEARPIAGLSLADLDPARIGALREALEATNSDEQLLAARSLVGLRGEVTIAAYLLLAARPVELMPHAHVRVLRHLDVVAATGRRQQVDGDVRVEGPIPLVLEGAMTQVETWMPSRQALQQDGRFGRVPVVPRDAWLEGIVNAVVHRSYSMAGDHVRVEIFPDRIEIESPGRFPGIVDPDRPLEIARYARNPRIARVCNDLGFTQEKGEGIRRIFDEMRLVGLVDPVYRQTSGSVRLTLFAAARIQPDDAKRLPTGADRALQVLRAAGRPLGTGDIAAAIGLQRPATLRALKALRGIGELEWSGRSPTDPRAVWRLPGHL